MSIEVSPYLADDTEGTLREVRRFWHTIDRPNLMVKIPSTPAGVPAITLIFAIENYRQVVEAYLGALEERNAKGQDISRIASVASFFVSRVDVLYAEELIGPGTVDTMTLKTIESFREHGRVRLSVKNQLPEAEAYLAALGNIGISYEQVTRQLQEEGVQRFADSFNKLFQYIDNRRKVL